MRRVVYALIILLASLSPVVAGTGHYTDFAFSPDGNWITAIGPRVEQLSIWDKENPGVRRTVAFDPWKVRFVLPVGGSNVVAVVADGGHPAQRHFTLVDLASGEKLSQTAIPKNDKNSADRYLYIDSKGKVIFSWSCCEKIVATYLLSSKLKSYDPIDPNEPKIVDSRRALLEQKRSFVVYDFKLGEVLLKVPYSCKYPTPQLYLSPTRGIAAVHCERRDRLDAFDIDTGGRVWTYLGASDGTGNFDFSSDGTKILEWDVANQEYNVIDAETGDVVSTAPFPDYENASPRAVSANAFVLQQSLAKFDIRLYDLETGTFLGQLKAD